MGFDNVGGAEERAFVYHDDCSYCGEHRVGVDWIAAPTVIVFIGDK